MKAATIIHSLVGLGFELAIVGNEIVVRRSAAGPLDLEFVKFLLKALKHQKPAVIAYLRDDKAPRQNIPSCNSCPWCLDNPWTHYPELPKWCGWWWDYLLADNPQCRDRREGQVPDPEPKPQSEKNKTSITSQSGPERATCYDCGHFQPAASSPNPTQVWGYCRRLDKGRYGVARACDAFQLARNTNHRRKEKACRK